MDENLVKFPPLIPSQEMLEFTKRIAENLSEAIERRFYALIPGTIFPLTLEEQKRLQDLMTAWRKKHYEGC